MTADRIPALLEPIQNRLNAAAAGPWRVEQHDLSLFVFSADEGLEANLGYVGNRPEADAAFIANAPTDQARLLAAIETVLAPHRPSRREHTKYNDRDVLISYTVTEDGPCVACYPEHSPTHCGDCEDESCTGHGTWWRQPWPCPTVAAVEAALGGEA